LPVAAAHYPAGWRSFSDRIRLERAKGRCECTGQCGLHLSTSFLRRCTEFHHTPARYFNGLVRLTVAHLCRCSPICTESSHVIAACQRCHLRIDRQLHAEHRAATRSAKKLARAVPSLP